MATVFQFLLDEATAREVREIAQALHRSPDDVAREAMQNGMHTLRRWIYLQELSRTVDVEDVVLRLRTPSPDRPLDPQETIPDDAA